MSLRHQTGEFAAWTILLSKNGWPVGVIGGAQHAGIRKQPHTGCERSTLVAKTGQVPALDRFLTSSPPECSPSATQECAGLCGLWQPGRLGDSLLPRGKDGPLRRTGGKDLRGRGERRFDPATASSIIAGSCLKRERWPNAASYNRSGTYSPMRWNRSSYWQIGCHPAAWRAAAGVSSHLRVLRQDLRG